MMQSSLEAKTWSVTNLVARLTGLSQILIVYSLQFAVLIVQRSVCSVKCAVCSAHFADWSVQREAYSVKSAVISVQSVCLFTRLESLDWSQ